MPAQKFVLLSLFLSIACLWSFQNFSVGNIQENSSDVIDHYCATDFLHRNLLNNKVYKNRHRNLEEDYFNAFSNPAIQNRTTNYLLPVVFHVIHQNGAENISDGLVNAGLQHLNEAFANTGYYDQNTGVDTEIQFCLARRDPDGNATTGINRIENSLTNLTLETEDLALKNLIRWNPQDYINIWIVGEICSSASGCGVAGYAYFPASHGNPEDGLVVEARWVGSSPENSSVLAHEIGHYLGLYHTFEGGCANASCLSNGDRVCDTPPDQSTAAVPCAFPGNSCTTDVNPADPDNLFVTDQNDMIINYMDYGDWACYSAFTAGQSSRMEFFITEARNSLLNSDACIDPCDDPVVALFAASLNPVNAGGTVVFSNNSFNATSYAWYIDGVLFSSEENPEYVFNDEGFFQVILYAANENPNCFDSDTLIIEVVCPVLAAFVPGSLEVRPGDNVFFNNNSVGATSYEWFIEDTMEGTDFAFNYTFGAEGNYQVFLVATDGVCTDTSAAVIITVTEEGLAQTGLPVWPLLVNGGELVQAADWRNVPPEVATIVEGGVDNNFSGQTGAAFDECGQIAFFVVHTGAPDQFQLFIYAPDGTPLLTTSTPNGPGLNSVKGGNEIQVIRVPETADEWFIIYSEWSTDVGAPGGNAGYNTAHLLYTKVQMPDAETLNVLERDIVLEDDNNTAYKYTDGRAVSRTANGNPDAHFIYACRRVPNVNTLSVDRFLIDNSGISFSANTGNVPANWWSLTAAGSPIELSPTEDVIAVLNRNQYANWPDVILFDAADFNNVNYQAISAGDLVLQADGTANDISAVLPVSGTVQSIAANNTYGLQYLQNYEKKLNGIEFSPNGRFLYLIGGGFVQGSYTNLTYLSQIDLETSPMEVRMQIQEPPYGNYNPTTGRGCSHNSGTCLENYNSVTHIESCFDGNLYFLKRISSALFVIPDPNNILPQNLVPSDIDLATPEEPNVPIAGRVAYIPDQIDGFNYLNAQYEEVVFLVNNQDCNGVCQSPYTVDILHNGNVVESMLLESCPDSIVFCADTSLIYGLAGPGNINFDFAIVETVVNYPGGSTLFDFSDNSACVEICDNEIDDDGDGLVDEFDLEDCPCVPYACGSETYNNCITCVQEFVPSEEWSVETVWIADIGAGAGQDTPVVGDVDGDCLPEVVVSDGPGEQILVLDGTTGNVEYTIDSYSSQGGKNGAPVIADVDADGFGDIFIIADNTNANPAAVHHRIVRYSFDGTNFNEAFVSSEAVGPYDDFDFYNGYRYSIIAMNIADINYDGRPEIIAGNEIFDAINGDFLAGGGSANSIASQRAWVSYTDYGNIGSNSVLADVLPDNYCPACSGLELVTGNMIYSINIPAGGGANSGTINVEVDMSSQFEDGFVAVADLNFDGSVDVISSQGNSTPHSYTFNIWNPEAGILYDQFTYAEPNAIGPGRTAIANLDTDASNLEFAFHIGSVLKVYQFDPATNTVSEQASTAVSDVSRTSVTVFDFNADGQNEVVYRDESVLRILNGTTLADMIAPFYSCSSGTNIEYPVITDVNGDGQTEILVACSDGLHLVGNAALNTFWAPSRMVWNQFSYFYTNINDDLTVPKQQQANHLAGDGIVLNNFLKQYSNPNFPVADLVVNFSLQCSQYNSVVTLLAEVCNYGDFNADEIPISFYDANPTSGVATVLADDVVDFALFPDSCVTLSLQIPAIFNTTLFAVINDDNSIAMPYDFETDFPFTGVPECDYTNNIDSAILYYNFETLELGPDITVCHNSVFSLNAGDGFATYEWFNGSSDSTYTAWEPGTYWVKVRDGCGNEQTDTVTISIAPMTVLDLGESQYICPQDTLEFSLTGFDNYQWFPDEFLDCATCETVHLFPESDMMYTVVGTTADGCISTDSFSVFVGESLSLTLDTTLCDDTVFYFNNNIIPVGGSATLYLESLVGCDTILQVNVYEGSGSTTQFIDTIICAEESLILEGIEFLADSDTVLYLQTFDNCDSTIFISVGVYPEYETMLDTSICANETFVVNGQPLLAGTDTVFNLTTIHGCDSLVNVVVGEIPSYYFSESILLCNGDSALVFDNFESLPGEYELELESQEGCDSVHVVVLDVLSPVDILLAPTFSCPGEISGSVNSVISGGLPPYFYNWSNGSTNTDGLENLAPGTYGLSVTDSYGCTATATFVIEELSEQQIYATAQPVTCYGYEDGSILLDSVEMELLYSLDETNFHPANRFDFLPSGTYQLFAQDIYGCVFATEITVNEPPELLLSLPEDTTIELGDSLTIQAIVNTPDSINYAWELAQWMSCNNCPAPVVTPLETQLYNLVVTNASGCSRTESVRVFVEKPRRVYIPNVFSPNGDGRNDIFTIFAGNDVESVLSFRVYDRWGELLTAHTRFQPNTLSRGWDGTFKGQPMQPGIFVYVIEVLFKDGLQEIYKGDVTLVR